MTAMTAEQADIITLAAFIATIFINRWASLFVLSHLLSDQLFSAIDSAIYYNLSAGVLYAAIGAAFVKLSYKLRQVFILAGALFWLSAVDVYLFPDTETIYYTSFSYIVGAVDLYVLILLLGGRRLECILSGAAQYWILAWRYRILWVSHSTVKQARERIR